MFEKIVAIEPVSLVQDAEKELYQYARTVVLHDDIPETEDRKSVV